MTTALVTLVLFQNHFLRVKDPVLYWVVDIGPQMKYKSLFT